jgi:cell division protein FtsL
MLETRLPLSSLPSTLPLPAVRPAPRREPPPAFAPRQAPRVSRPTVPRRAARRALVRSRLARSEARMLTLAVAVTALMCAVLVVYLAAYAHVTQLGLEQAAAHRQLAQEISDGRQLEVEQAELQDRGRIVAEARKLHMTLYTGPMTYVTASGNNAPPGAEGGEGDTSADDGDAAHDH